MKPASKTKKRHEDERRLIKEWKHSENELDVFTWQSRLEVKLPLRPISKKTGKQQSEVNDKEKVADSHKRLIDQRKNNKLNCVNNSSGPLNKQFFKKDFNDKTERITIDCALYPTEKRYHKEKKQLTKSVSSLLFNSSPNSCGNESDNDPISMAWLNQKKEDNYVTHKFLSQIDLVDELFDTFIENDIINNEQWNSLTDAKLADMKISEKHRFLILTHIQEIKDGIYNDNHNIIMHSENNEASNEMGTQCEKHGKTLKQEVKEVYDVEENERIQAELFKQAVEEFRRGGISSNNNNNERSSINTDTSAALTDYSKHQSEVTIVDPKKFLCEIGGNAWFSLNSISLFADEGNDIKDDCEYLPEWAIGKACWECWKIISKAYPINVDQKFFCSSECCTIYKTKNEVKCGFCSKMFFKNNGVLNKGAIFCSVECYEKDMNKIIEKADEEDEEHDNGQEMERERDIPNEGSGELVDILDI